MTLNVQAVRAAEGGSGTSAELDRTVASLTLGWLCCQPRFERSIYPRLPAWTAGSKGTDDILIEADSNLLLRWFLVRATRSSERGNRCSYTATGGGNCVAPVDFGLS
jgi:hypothetical protein